MSTIPASELVAVNPSVLAVGGSALDIIGLFLTSSTRIPIGTVQSFPDVESVNSFFGASAQEASLATTYFSGFDGADKRPAAMLFSQYNASAVSAYVRGGNISAMTLANLQALSGVMTIVADGTTHAGTINLSGANSFSNAAAIIQTALNLGASVTGAIAANVVTGAIAPNVITGSISGTTMTVSAITTGVLGAGQTVSGSGVAVGTTIVSQLTGTAGSTGTYQVSISQTVGSTTITASGGGLTVSAVITGTLAVGQTISGSGVTAGTRILGRGTGTGGTGTYFVDTSQTATSTTITANGGTLTVSAVGAGVLAVGDVIAGSGVTLGNTIAAQLTGTGGTGTYLVSVGDTVGSETLTVSGAGVVATYDSVSGAFRINSGIVGTASTMAFPTGAIATSLLLTAATGAVLSQGAAGTAPAAFMDGLVAVSTDWVTFTTTFDPDSSGNTQKQAFAAWNTAQNDRYAYICWDTDPAPAASTPAAGSLGAILEANGNSGTSLWWAPDAASGATLAAFVMGAGASINYGAPNGRTTFAYRSQAGLLGTVTSALAANNLGGNPQTGGRGNGYNFYGAYGAANASFIWAQRGFVTGDFLWLDSYLNQVWLNNAFQLALLGLLANAKSVPYSAAGNTMIEAALADPIEAGLSFEAFGPGAISAAQIAEVNAEAGSNIAAPLQTQGWYLQILPASSTVRAQRGTPPSRFWYLDRGSVQAITLNSVAVQ